MSSYDAAVNLPWVLGETAFLVPGLAYHADSISYESAPLGSRSYVHSTRWI